MAIDALLHLGGRPSWQNPELPSLNRLEGHATLVPFRSAEDAARLDPARSPWYASLDGDWEFRLVRRPDEAAAALAATRGWSRVEVPGLWTMQGYDRPKYTNVADAVRGAAPERPEENPTGIYRRRFTLPRGWARAPRRPATSAASRACSTCC